MRSFAPDATRLVTNLLRLNGRDPTGYEVGLLEDGSICVRSPTAAACYPLEGWISKFNKHLHRGFFDGQTALANASAHAG